MEMKNRMIIVLPSPARVYAILAGQLLITAGSCILFGLYPPLANYRQNIIYGNVGGMMASIPLIGVIVSTIGKLLVTFW